MRRQPDLQRALARGRERGRRGLAGDVPGELAADHLNLPLLAFSWVAGLRLARQDVAPQAALRDAGLILAGHWLLSAGLQGAYRLKNHALDIFLTADLPGLLARAITLFFVSHTGTRSSVAANLSSAND